MPGGDRTGPRGEGPRTGRRAGLCAGYKMPGYANRIIRPTFRGRPATDLSGRTQGRGRGGRERGRRAGGRGFRRW